MAQNWTVKVSHIESEALSTLKLYWLFYQMMHFYALLILPLSKMFADFSSRRFSPKFNCHPHTGWLNASPDKITIVFLMKFPVTNHLSMYIYTIIDYNDTIMYKKYIQYIYIHMYPYIPTDWLVTLSYPQSSQFCNYLVHGVQMGTRWGPPSTETTRRSALLPRLALYGIAE